MITSFGFVLLICDFVYLHKTVWYLIPCMRILLHTHVKLWLCRSSCVICGWWVDVSLYSINAADRPTISKSYQLIALSLILRSPLLSDVTIQLMYFLKFVVIHVLSACLLIWRLLQAHLTRPWGQQVVSIHCLVVVLSLGISKHTHQIQITDYKISCWISWIWKQSWSNNDCYAILYTTVIILCTSCRPFDWSSNNGNRRRIRLFPELKVTKVNFEMYIADRKATTCI